MAVPLGRNPVVFLEGMLKNEYERILRFKKLNVKSKELTVKIQTNGRPNIKEKNLYCKMIKQIYELHFFYPF